MSALSLNGICKTFDGKMVLDEISLDIAEDSITAIIGPSGAGKSVLLKIITGLLEPDAGSVKISDSESNLGVLFQEAALFDFLTLYENVEFPLAYFNVGTKTERKERVENLLSEVGALKFANKYPSEVSISVRKCVGIARALVREPKIILFDEPNTSLDPLAGQEVYNLILKTKDKWNYTGLVISHEIPEVFQVCDQVAMLYCGKIIERGSVKEFSASSNQVVRQFIDGTSTGPIK